MATRAGSPRRSYNWFHIINCTLVMLSFHHINYVFFNCLNTSVQCTPSLLRNVELSEQLASKCHPLIVWLLWYMITQELTHRPLQNMAVIVEFLCTPLWYLKHFLCQCLQVNATGSQWWQINIGLGNGNRPWAKSMLPKFYNYYICRHQELTGNFTVLDYNCNVSLRGLARSTKGMHVIGVYNPCDGRW